MLKNSYRFFYILFLEGNRRPRDRGTFLPVLNNQPLDGRIDIGISLYLL